MIPMFPPKEAAYLDELDDFLGWCKDNKVVIRDSCEHLKKPDHVPANNENKEICTACGGYCCKHMPGAFFPEDFPTETKRKQILAGLRDGRFQIDWWEGDKPKYYLRPAVTNDRRTFCPSWGGQCIFLTPTGCPFEFKGRPRGCRELIPNPNLSGDCGSSMKNDKEAAKEAWEKDEIFQAIIKEFQEMGTPVDQEGPQ